KKLTPLYPKFGLRIANSTSSIIQVSGTKNAAEHDEVISVIQGIWEDDSWIPA
ncbi:TPA: DinI-like family protein, partial [Yersinia enterocolitica]